MHQETPHKAYLSLNNLDLITYHITFHANSIMWGSLLALGMTLSNIAFVKALAWLLYFVLTGSLVYMQWHFRRYILASLLFLLLAANALNFTILII